MLLWISLTMSVRTSILYDGPLAIGVGLRRFGEGEMARFDLRDASLRKSRTVEVTSHSGETFSERLDITPGHRDHPLTQDQREQKFATCMERQARTYRTLAVASGSS